LQEYRHLSPERAAQLAILPLFCGGSGCFIGGLISPYITRWTGSVRKTRRLLGYLGSLGAGALLLVHTGIEDPVLAMIAMGMASFCNDIIMPGSWGACMDVGGKYAGTLSGSMNMMGNLAGGVAPVVAGYVLQATGSWTVNLYIMAGIYVLAALSWRLIDPVTPLEEQSR
jgi:nitrate/nitrite transporter NarK